MGQERARKETEKYVGSKEKASDNQLQQHEHEHENICNSNNLSDININCEQEEEDFDLNIIINSDNRVNGRVSPVCGTKRLLTTNETRNDLTRKWMSGEIDDEKYYDIIDNNNQNMTMQ